MGLIEKLKEEKPGRNYVFTAIETLTDPQEIKQFYSEYIVELKKETKAPCDPKDDPKTVANSNIGYIVGYYDKATADRWMKTLSDVSHPIFGRDIFSVSPEDAFEAGKIASQKGSEGVRCYIEQRRK